MLKMNFCTWAERIRLVAFGRFSSSYWFSGESYKQVSDTGVKGTSYFYLLAGEQEGGQQTGDMEKMVVQQSQLKTMHHHFPQTQVILG